MCVMCILELRGREHQKLHVVVERRARVQRAAAPLAAPAFRLQQPGAPLALRAARPRLRARQDASGYPTTLGP